MLCTRNLLISGRGTAPAYHGRRKPSRRAERTRAIEELAETAALPPVARDAMSSSNPSNSTSSDNDLCPLARPRTELDAQRKGEAHAIQHQHGEDRGHARRRLGTEVTEATLAVLEPLGERHGLGLRLERFQPAPSLPRYRQRHVRGDFPPRRGRRRHPARRDGLARHPLPGRHRNRAAARTAAALTSTPGCGRCARSPACRWRWPTRAAGYRLGDPSRDTEGLFHSRGRGAVTVDAAEETLRITRGATEKLSRFAFRLAERRAARRGDGLRGRVTLVDKANVFRAFAFMRAVFDEVAAEFPDVEPAHHYVDAMALDLVRRPWAFDVLVTENMFGDILSRPRRRHWWAAWASRPRPTSATTCRVPAVARHGAGHRRAGHRQPDRACCSRRR